MESNSEEVKRLAELKARLHRRLEALREETEMLESLLSIIDSILVTKSFKTAETPRPTATPVAVEAKPAEAKPEEFTGQVFQLKASDGTLLAKMYTTDDEVRVVVEPDLNLYLSTPPFQTFLVDRILKAMEAKDRELVSSGQLPPENAFRFDVKVEGDFVKEIYIKNYRDKRRLRELRTSIRWTLEKMYEKQRV